MNYGEIIRLQDEFIGHYNIDSEEPNYWKRYVATEKFYEILNKSLDAFIGQKLDDQKSMWIQGVYGSGKSHTMAVVKHLFWDELPDISEFIEDVVLNDQYKNKLKRFRSEKKVFPVVIKGKDNLSSSNTFSYVIQKAVLDALKKENISEIVTDSDFQKIILKIEDPALESLWNTLFDEEPELYMTCKDKDQLLSLLNQKNIDALKLVNEILNKRGYVFTENDVSTWLSQILVELKEKQIADYLMIYWDEFTQVLNIDPKGTFLDDVQQIADKSRKSGVYFFIGSHKSIEQSGIDDSVKKVKDRFNRIDYKMESNTTYRIIRTSLVRKDMGKIKNLISNYYDNPEMNKLISELSDVESIQTKDDIKYLFPIHPYSGYLSTFISRYLSSSSRSVFRFLYDENNNGFMKFIQDNPNENGDVFLTPDYLFDYFLQDFENSLNEGYTQILNRYRTYNEKIISNGREYSAVFKTLVLLNLLNKTLSSSEGKYHKLITPSETTLKKIFLGTNFYGDLGRVLDYIDTEGIIQKTPDGEFLISTSSLPNAEVQNEINKLSSSKNDITQIFGESDTEEIKKIFEISRRRELDIEIFDPTLKKDILIARLNKAFQKPYKIPIAFFVSLTESDIVKFRESLPEIKSRLNKDIVFVISKNVLSDKRHSNVISYGARSNVAKNHNLNEDYQHNLDCKNKLISQWVSEIKSGTVDIILKNNSETILSRDISNKILDYSKEMFSYGLENLPYFRHNENIWKQSLSKKAVQSALFSTDFRDLNSKFDQHLREIPNMFMSNNQGLIVTPELNFTENLDTYHPLMAMNSKIDEIIKKEKNVFNLGTTLEFLTKPPYGIYKNHINMAAIAFIFRKYADNLYEAKTGKVIDQVKMADKILKLFEYFESGNNRAKSELDVRSGSEEEQKLKNLLESTFKLPSDKDSSKTTQWKIRQWVRNSGYPIWVYKLEKGINGSIDSIMEFIDITDEKQMSTEQIDKIYHTIEQSSSDLRIKLSKENSKKLFIKWLKIQDPEYSDEEFSEIIQYLKKMFHENVETWSESEVASTLKDRLIKKLKAIRNDEKPEIPVVEPKLPENVEPKLPENVEPKLPELGRSNVQKEKNNKKDKKSRI